MKRITPRRAGIAATTALVGVSMVAMTAAQAFPPIAKEVSPVLKGDNAQSCEIVQDKAAALFQALDIYLEEGSSDRTRGFIADAVEDYRPLTSPALAADSASNVIFLASAIDSGVSNLNAERLRDGSLSADEEWMALSEVGIAQEELAYLCADITGVPLEGQEFVPHPVDTLSYTLGEAIAQGEWEDELTDPTQVN